MHVKRLRNVLLLPIALAWSASGPLASGVDAPAAAGAPARSGAAGPVAGGTHEGAQALGLTLRRLGTTKRVLMIGAHPDDENTALLAAFALGQGADVAYLSLTRGDGGQNLIGPELQEGLGLIRSEELLAARRLDGARQYFTRAYDYGYSKSADEAFRHWPRDSVLADAVEVIRAFRPDVILSVWSGTPGDGHGQHQAAGLIAREAFDAAADPRRFGGQIAAGRPAHRARYLFQSSWRPTGDVRLSVQTGQFDPLFGRSHFQIAMASRSLHRSQDQGSAQTPGPQGSALVAMAGPIPDRGASVFAGVDTTLTGIAREAVASPALDEALASFERAVAAVTASFNPLRPASLLPGLALALAALDRADSIAAAIGAAADEIRFRIRAEREHAVAAMRLAAGLVLDATADRTRLIPGESFTLTLQLWNGGAAALAVESLEPALPAGWSARALDPPPQNVSAGQMATRRFRIEVPGSAELSEPYFLRSPRLGDLYAWPADPDLRGEPFEPPPVRGEARIGVAGARLALSADASYVEVDKAQGEYRRPLRVVPVASVLAEPRVSIVPLGVTTDGNGVIQRELVVTVTADASNGVEGVLRLDLPDGWSSVPASAPVRLGRAGERATVRFALSVPAGLAEGRHDAAARLELADGRTLRRGYTTIDYPHIEPRLLFRDAVTTFSAFPVRVATGLRIGYIEGAGDDGAAALAQLGLAVEPIGPDAIRSGDLRPYDVIVAGIRAYEVRPDLVAANARLLEYVREGGTFIVQYNKQEYVEGGFAPYRVSMGRSAGRVADETAPVRFVAPSHPVLTVPNRIGPADFEGWVQERGLYFVEAWDDRYTPILEMADAGESPLGGSLLVTKYGNGTYAYVALSFFRQLPEGVPGAYRLLANLIALGAR